LTPYLAFNLLDEVLSFPLEEEITLRLFFNNSSLLFKVEAKNSVFKL
jgi:hypothetical protein